MKCRYCKKEFHCCGSCSIDHWSENHYCAGGIRPGAMFSDLSVCYLKHREELENRLGELSEGMLIMFTAENTDLDLLDLAKDILWEEYGYGV